jgi:hypothetical protein
MSISIPSDYIIDNADLVAPTVTVGTTTETFTAQGDFSPVVCCAVGSAAQSVGANGPASNLTGTGSGPWVYNLGAADFWSLTAGSASNFNNGTFTCPIAGTYRAFFQLSVTQTEHVGVISNSILHNGNSVAYAMMNFPLDTAAPGTNGSCSCELMLSLAVGDTIHPTLTWWNDGTDTGNLVFGDSSMQLVIQMVGTSVM